MSKAKRLGLAGGIIWGLMMFITTIISIYTGYGDRFLEVMASIYPGYDISWGGSVIGGVYGFLDAGIGLWLLGWLYTKFGE